MRETCSLIKRWSHWSAISLTSSGVSGCGGTNSSESVTVTAPVLLRGPPVILQGPPVLLRGPPVPLRCPVDVFDLVPIWWHDNCNVTVTVACTVTTSNTSSHHHIVIIVIIIIIIIIIITIRVCSANRSQQPADWRVLNNVDCFSQCKTWGRLGLSTSN